ncbi:MAG: PatB family C-S lyase [Alphaproteobacteria bacterium]|nr:PatB family C-S lyase [Alphaproteobacteria bacterium]
MKFNIRDFDKVYNRRDTNSLKWDSYPKSDLPMWVADMDFKCPEDILKELELVVKQGILGYPLLEDARYFRSVINWFNNYHNINIDRENIIPVIGVMSALNSIIEEFTNENDTIVIQSPVYFGIINEINFYKRNLVYSLLNYNEDEGYTMDYSHLNELKKVKPKLLILCSPHNPVGRVWSKRELEKIGDFCLENNVLLVVDEIHCDLILEKFNFTSYASLDQKYLKNTIIMNSSTKTFNIAGLRGGNVFVFDKKIKDTLTMRFNHYGLSKLNSFFVAATIVGYSSCRSWHELLLKYINQNYQFVRNFIKNEIPTLKVSPLEGTYLVWINYQQLNIPESIFFKELEKNIIVAKGSEFGPGGEGFFRINIACPLDTLKEAFHFLKIHINSFKFL